MGICQTCGGVNGPYGTKEVVDIINTGAPNPWAFVCPGHNVTKHDGVLDDYTVSYANPIYAVFGPTEGIRIECQGGSEKAELTYEQALSLLSWLQQEQPTLEKMVGVEKDTPKE